MSRRSKKLKRAAMDAVRKEQDALKQNVILGEDTKMTIGELCRQRINNGHGDTLNIPKMQIPASTLPAAVQLVQRPKDWPECPKTCDPVEWYRALENRDHYLLTKMSDSDSKPWFQYPRYIYQYSEFVYCTPEMMTEMMKYNFQNRKIDLAWVEAIRRDILNHCWLQTHESIAINKDGNMQDGQHRGQGVINAGVGWPIYITWNVPPESIYAIDSGKKRSVNEKLDFLYPQLKGKSKVPALCRAMMYGLCNRGNRYSESEIAAFLIEHKHTVTWVLSKLGQYRADLQAVIGKALLWWGEEKIEPFADRLGKLLFSGDGDPVKTLYKWMQDTKAGHRPTSPVDFYQKSLAAIYAHVSNKETKRLIAKEADIFEWLPGWKVPENSPCQGVVFKE